MPSRTANGEGSIYPERVGGKETGRWIAQVTLEMVNGLPRYSRKFFDSERKAHRGLAAMIAERDAGIIGSSATVQTHLEDYLDNHLQARRGGNIAKSTVENYKYSARHVTDRIGSLRMDRLTPADVENRLLRPMADEGYSHSSLMRARLILSLAMAHAVRRGELPRNVAALPTIPPTTPREPRKSLTPQQAQDLLRVARGERLEAAIVTQLMLGLRPGELLGLKWSDLNAKGDVLRVQRSVKIEGGVLLLGEPKTEASNRPLRIPQPVKDALKKHKARQKDERKYAEAWTDLGLIFPTSTGNIMDRHNYRRTLRRIVEKAEIEGSWTSHEIRHTAISLLCDAGVPLEQVADQVGHVDTRMIQRVYRHRLGTPVDAAVDTMNELFA
jgi:integrase